MAIQTSKQQAYSLFILFISIFSILLIGVITIVPISPESLKIIEFLDYVICAIFFVDFLISFIRAENKRRVLFHLGLVRFAFEYPRSIFSSIS